MLCLFQPSRRHWIDSYLLIISSGKVNRSTFHIVEITLLPRIRFVIKLCGSEDIFNVPSQALVMAAASIKMNYLRWCPSYKVT